MGNTKQTGKSCVDGSLLSMRRELIYGQVTFLALAFAKAAFLALDFVRPAFQVPPFAEAVYRQHPEKNLCALDQLVRILGSFTVINFHRNKNLHTF